MKGVFEVPTTGATLMVGPSVAADTSDVAQFSAAGDNAESVMSASRGE